MVHHLIKERDQKDICPYCGVDLAKEEWNSVFHLNFHYKTTDCECGKVIRRKVDFLGSNHDKLKTTSIDGIVREIKPFEIVKK